MTRTVKLEFEISNRLLDDTIITAVEGAINYWAITDGRVIIDVYEGEELGEPVILSRDLIQKGIEFALSGQYCNERIRGYIMNAVTEDDASFIDADAADVIVQLGLFDGLIYA